MNGPILTLLAAIVAGLFLLGGLGVVLRRQARAAIGFGGAALGGLGTILSLLSLVLDGEPVRLRLPIGLPGTAFHLGIDPLSGFFALLIFAVGTVAIVYAAEADPPGSGSSLAGMAVALAGLVLAALAGDGVAFAAGLAIAGGAIWATGGGGDSPASPGPLWVTLGAAITVLALPAVPATTPVFGRLLLLAELVALAALAPLHAWLARAQSAALPHAGALLAGAAVPLAFYALIRLTFLPSARPLPDWSGLPPLVLGAASLVIGGFQATRAETLDACLAAGTVRQSGLMAMALGVALTARAQDQPGLAAVALGALLLGAATQALCGTLAVLAAGALRRGAATRQLSRLGGVIHRMPAAAICLMAAMFGLAALPPGLGFATLWLMFQAVLAEVQSAGLAFRAVFVAAVWVLGIGGALAAASLVRLIGVACLGRPRTPRAAVAEQLPRAARIPLLCLAAATLALGCFVGPVVRWLADPAIREVLGSDLGPRSGLLGLAATPGGPGYAALPIAFVLCLAGGIALWLRRRFCASDSRTGPAWEGGFAAPPPWLPFGDPVTQTAGAGFTPLPDELPRLSPPIRWPVPRPLDASCVAIAMLVVLLVLVGWL